MTKRQKRQVRSALDASEHIAYPQETVEDAVLEFVARERLVLNSALLFEYGDLLGAELGNAVDAIAQVEIVQRYHALVRLLKANAVYENGKEYGGAPNGVDSLRLAKAAESARSRAWTVISSEFGTRITAIEV